MSPSQQVLPITLFKISLGILYPTFFFPYSICHLTCHMIWLFYLLSVFTANLQAAYLCLIIRCCSYST